MLIAVECLHSTWRTEVRPIPEPRLSTDSKVVPDQLLWVSEIVE